MDEKEHIKLLKDFFLWLIHTAKIEIIDAEEHIEAHGFAKGDLCPIYSIEILIKMYRKKEGIENDKRDK